MDTGATSHILSNKELFTEFDKSFDPAEHYLELADGNRYNDLAKGRGKAIIYLNDIHGDSRPVTLRDALYVPSYPKDILSVTKATNDDNMTFMFTKNNRQMQSSDGHVFNMKMSGNLCYLYTVSEKSVKNYSVAQWHEILGHCNIHDVLKLENVVEGMHIIGKKTTKQDCDVCTKAKMFQNYSKVPDKKATKPFEFVHCDLNGPINVENNENLKYVLIFVDDFTGYLSAYLLQKKSDTIEATKKFLADIAPYGKVTRLRSDNEMIFKSENLNEIMIDNQIKHEFCSPFSSHQNGTAERSFRTIFDMTRCLIIGSNLPEHLWPYAIQASIYIRNRCFNPRLGITAYEAATNTKPYLGNLHIFGSKCFAYVQNKGKLDPRSQQGIFIGYDKYSPAYLIYFPEDGTISKVRSVKFTDKTSESTQSGNTDPDTADGPPVQLIQPPLPGGELHHKQIKVNLVLANKDIRASTNPSVDRPPLLSGDSLLRRDGH